MSKRNTEMSEEKKTELVVWTDDLFNIIETNGRAREYLKRYFDDISKLKIDGSSENIVFIDENKAKGENSVLNKDEVIWKKYEQRNHKGVLGFIIIGEYLGFYSIDLCFQEIIEKMPGSVYWKDKDGKYLGCNQFVAKMAGLPSINDVIGKTDFDMPWKEIAEEIRNTDSWVMQEKCSIEIEERPALSDANELLMLTNKQPLLNKYNKLIGVIGTSIDITELKNTQQALSESMEKITKAYKDKLDFISMVSHEIRGPISNSTLIMSLLSDSEILQNCLKKEEKKLLDMSLLELKHTLKSMSYLIELFKTEDKKTEYAEFDLKEFINDISNGFNDNIKIPVFDIKVSKKIKLIKSDMFFIKEILQILIDNSIRFSEDTPHIKINVDYNNEKSNIIICISDKGIGISPETLLNLNKEISSDDLNKHAKNYYNVSIRLTYLKKILNFLGGVIKIESKKGKGTDAFIFLPLVTKLSEKVNHKKANIEKSSTKIKALLVEDNNLTREIEKKILIDSGIIVDACSDGATAINMGKNGNYDVVFLDISLPDIDGIEVLKGIKPYVNESTVFVAVTSHVTEEDIENFLENGFATAMAKPISKNIVLGFLENIKSYRTNES